MPYCSQCGKEVTAEMAFCPYCGNSLATTTTAVSDQFYSVDQNEVSTYKVYITSIGTANKLAVKELLEDVLSYSSVRAQELVNNIPVQIADNLTLAQATYIAQAFEEYGVELTVANGDVYTDVKGTASSVYNSDGTFVAGAAAVLATLGAVNRVTGINRWRRPSLFSQAFHSLFSRNAPPVHIRRNVVRRPLEVTGRMQPRTFREVNRMGTRRYEPGRRPRGPRQQGPRR